MAGETVVSQSDAIAITHYSVTLMTEMEKKSVFIRMMKGRRATQSMALAKRERQQTSADMPIVEITDLQKMPGDTVTCDMFHIVSGLPVVGDEVAEGRGSPLTFSTMEVMINQLRFPINAGGRMTRKRTRHNLRAIARANMSSYFARLNDEIIQVHMAGARGRLFTKDWNVPLEDHPAFKKIMINPVEPPTKNRYFVAGGGNDVSDIGDTDALKLEDLDVMGTALSDLPFPPSPIQVDTDDMGGDMPLWCLLVSYRVWHYIETRTGGSVANAWRKAVAEGTTRKNMSKHPLFRSGENAVWGRMLIKLMPRAIRFNAGDTVKLTNADGTVDSSKSVSSSFNTNQNVERSILLGGQALALALGDGGRSANTGFPMRWSEVLRDHGNSVEILAGQVGGVRKFVFDSTDGEKTDFGIAVIDSYAPDTQSTEGAALRTALAS